MKAKRELGQLVSVGPAMLRDFELLGISSVAQLANRSPKRMYDDLCRTTGERQDPCVLDTFSAAVAQARNPLLPPEQCQWWYWSQKRKSATGNRRRATQDQKTNTDHTELRYTDRHGQERR